MTYKTYLISNKDELARCPVFEIKHFQWTSRQQPKTYGQMGYLDNQGLYLRITSLERNPKRLLTNHRDMVCKDSAIEAFFAFPDTSLQQTDPPQADSLYFNFEVNANGAMYAKYGYGRKNRQFLTDEEYALTGVQAQIESDRWMIELLIPLEVLKRVGGILRFAAGDIFFCNFYKISEDPAIEHYASYSPIDCETPNFHLPQYFAQAVVTAFEH